MDGASESPSLASSSGLGVELSVESVESLVLVVSSVVSVVFCSSDWAVLSVAESALDSVSVVPHASRALSIMASVRCEVIFIVLPRYCVIPGARLKNAAIVARQHLSDLVPPVWSGWRLQSLDQISQE